MYEIGIKFLTFRWTCSFPLKGGIFLMDKNEYYIFSKKKMFSSSVQNV